MKKTFLALALACVAFAPARAQKKDIVKTGLNIGPLPVVAYDADKGLQLGAILQLFDYGDGSRYPNYDSKWYFEASFFTKGSQLYQIMYDNKDLIPGVRWSSAINMTFDKGMDFFGFNGYKSYYDFNSITAGKNGETFIFTPFYKSNRIQILAKSDFIGKISGPLKWEAGYHLSWFKQGAIDYANINKGKSDLQRFPEPGEPGYVSTLFELYRKWGIISDDEANGGLTSSIRAGLVYDTRDKEGAPSRGIWAEAHLTAAPKWLGTKNSFYRYSFTFRNYLPIVSNDILTFAYRLNYEGTIGSSAPYYILPYITVMGDTPDRDGMGGYRTVRGIARNRVVGLDMATYTAEMRWRFARFHIGQQNIALALNAFSDGAMVTRGRNLSFGYDPSAADYATELQRYNSIVKNDVKEIPHITCGAGFRFIMNENFIVAAEYGLPISKFYKKDSPYYNQDGTGAFYVNIGYLF